MTFPAKFPFTMSSSDRSDKLITEFNDYQEKASKTAVYPKKGKAIALMYTALGLAGEAGEVANQVKKILRDDNMEITPERYAKIKDELGDVLWYVAAMCSELMVNMGGIANSNIEKLAQRAAEDQIHGDQRKTQEDREKLMEQDAARERDWEEQSERNKHDLDRE
jgi:NTP pyrophosphatase (non-canonical NTP hydrolase)